MLAEQRLRLRLRDEEDEREARVAGAEVAQPEARRAAAVEVEAQRRRRVPARDERVGEIVRLQQLERPRLHADRARLVRPVERPVDEPEGDAERRELRGEREPGRTGADDDRGPAVRVESSPAIIGDRAERAIDFACIPRIGTRATTRDAASSSRSSRRRCSASARPSRSCSSTTRSRSSSPACSTSAPAPGSRSSGSAPSPRRAGRRTR